MDSLKRRRAQETSKADVAAALAEEGTPPDGASKTPLLEVRGLQGLAWCVQACRPPRRLQLLREGAMRSRCKSRNHMQ